MISYIIVYPYIMTIPQVVNTVIYLHVYIYIYIFVYTLIMCIYIYCMCIYIYISPSYPIIHAWLWQGPVPIGLCWTAGGLWIQPGRASWGVTSHCLGGSNTYCYNLLCFNMFQHVSTWKVGNMCMTWPPNMFIYGMALLQTSKQLTNHLPHPGRPPMFLQKRPVRLYDSSLKNHRFLSYIYI